MVLFMRFLVGIVSQIVAFFPPFRPCNKSSYSPKRARRAWPASLKPSLILAKRTDCALTCRSYSPVGSQPCCAIATAVKRWPNGAAISIRRCARSSVRARFSRPVARPIAGCCPASMRLPWNGCWEHGYRRRPVPQPMNPWLWMAKPCEEPEEANRSPNSLAL